MGRPGEEAAESGSGCWACTRGLSTNTPPPPGLCVPAAPREGGPALREKMSYGSITGSGRLGSRGPFGGPSRQGYQPLGNDSGCGWGAGDSSGQVSAVNGAACDQGWCWPWLGRAVVLGPVSPFLPGWAGLGSGFRGPCGLLYPVADCARVTNVRGSQEEQVTRTEVSPPFHCSMRW